MRTTSLEVEPRDIARFSLSGEIAKLSILVYNEQLERVVHDFPMGAERRPANAGCVLELVNGQNHLR